MTGTLSFSCASCHEPMERPFPGPDATAPCARCGAEPELLEDAVVDGAVSRCPPEYT